jgi:hypothetical protein
MQFQMTYGCLLYSYEILCADDLNDTVMCRLCSMQEKTALHFFYTYITRSVWLLRICLFSLSNSWAYIIEIPGFFPIKILPSFCLFYHRSIDQGVGVGVGVGVGLLFSISKRNLKPQDHTPTYPFTNTHKPATSPIRTPTPHPSSDCVLKRSFLLFLSPMYENSVLVFICLRVWEQFILTNWPYWIDSAFTLLI